MADILDIIEQFLANYTPDQPSEFSAAGTAAAQACPWGHTGQLYNKRSHQATNDTHLACHACETDIRNDPQHTDPYL